MMEGESKVFVQAGKIKASKIRDIQKNIFRKF